MKHAMDVRHRDRSLFATIRVATTCLAIVLGAVATHGQALVGNPPFASVSTSSFDAVDNATLGVTFGVPILRKAGRDLPFNFSLAYNGYIWTPQVSGSSTVWTPTTNSYWGWTSFPTGAGSVSYQTTLDQCFQAPGGKYTWTVWSNFIYTDNTGTQHPFNFSISDWELLNTPCGNGPSNYGSGVAIDGSGYTLSVQGTTSGQLPVQLNGLTDRSGNTYGASITASPGSGTVTDPNGNTLSMGYNAYYDTLSSSTPVLTVAGSGTPTSPITYTYSGPSGNEVYTIKYTQYNVQTNFGCSGITEYGATAQNLVSEIDLPDQGTYPNHKYTFMYETTFQDSSSVTGRLASVTLPTGATITYTYGISGKNEITCTDGIASYLTRQTPDTGSGYWQYTHSESGSQWSTVADDPEGNSTTYSFQGMYETQRVVKSNTGTTVLTVNTCYNGSVIPCTGTGITLPISSITAQTTLPGQSPSQTVTTLNSYGLASEIDEYDWGPSIARKTITNYSPGSCGITGSYVEDRPCSVTIENGSGGTVASTSNTYFSTGNLESTTSGGLTRSFTYNGTGTVATATDVNNATTTYGYGSSGCNAFPTSIAPPVGPSITLTWNCAGAVLTNRSDSNGQTIYGYTDPFWRVTSITDPNATLTEITYLPNSVERATNFASTSTVDSLTTLDGLGRVSISQRRQAQGSNSYDSVQTVYDFAGRPGDVSAPYSAGAGVGYGGTAWNVTGYDPLNRPTYYGDAAGGVTTYTYSANDVLLTLGPAPSGENTKSRQLEYNGLGQLTSVCEVTSSSGSGPCGQTTSATGFRTSYTHNALNDLLTVSQSGQSRTYSYDQLGRLTSESNPESGTTRYTYDSVSSGNCSVSSPGDLLLKLDNAGNGTCLMYDAGHRLVSVGQSNNNSVYASVTPDKCFIYDSAQVDGSSMSYTAGRLAEAYTVTQGGGCGASKLTDEGFSYNPGGRATDLYESTPHSGGYYHVSAPPWPNGLPETLNLYSGSTAMIPTITFNPDGEGRLGSTSVGGGQNPLSSATFSAGYGLPTSLTFGSNDSDAFGYDLMGRLTSYAYNVGSSTVSGLSSWNPNGSLGALEITDPIYSGDNQTCAYRYDDLGRIASTGCAGDIVQNPGFENGNVGWLVNDGWSIVNNPANAQSGNWYLQGSSTTNSTSSAEGPNGSLYIPVTPGENITYGGWIERVAGTGLLSWDCGVTDANHNVIAWCPPAQIGDGSGGTGWELYSQQYTIPSGGVYLIFFASVHCCGDSDNSLTTGYFDSAFVEGSDGSSAWSQTFSYDVWGNLSKSGSITFQPGTYTSNQVPSSVGHYDANGNLTQDPVQSYGYDADGNAISIVGIGLTYDAFDRMVEQSGSGYRQIVYWPAGGKLALMGGQTLSKGFVPLPAGAMAVYEGSGLAYYRHPDWLGSSHLASTYNQQVCYDGAYAPFGENYSEYAPCWYDRSFAGINQDTLSSSNYPLYDALNREYHPVWGRWLNPDPAGMASVDPTNPQSWNRYAYVTNNPISLNDPLGLGDAGQACGGFAMQFSWFCSLMGGGGGGGGFPSMWTGFDYMESWDCSSGECTTYVNDNMLGVLSGPPLGGGGAANNGLHVHRTFQRTFQCSSSASGVMNALESNFASFANNPASGAFSTFSIFTPEPVSPGGQIGIDVGVQAGGHTIGYSDVSVTVQSATPSQLVFQSDPGHVLYPATVSFSASDAGSGSITFTTSVNATTNGLWGTAQFYLLGGRAGETSTWNNLLNNVAGFCAQPSHP